MSFRMWRHMCLFYLFATLNVITCFLSSDIIINHSRLKNISHGTIFSCITNKREKNSLLKHLMVFNLQFLLLDVNGFIDIQTVLHRNNYHLGVVLDGDCKNFTTVLSEYVDKKYFYETYHWLITSTSKKMVLPALDKAKLNINSDVHVAIPVDIVENQTYAIYDVYNSASEHGGKLTVTEIGYYTKCEGYKTKILRNKYWERRDMTGVKFTSAIVIPYLDKPLKEYLSNDGNRQINSMHRFQSTCVNYCKDFFNFSLKIQRTDSWGYVQENGHFDGLVGLLERKIVDFGSSPLIFKLDRMPFVDYGYGNWILRSTFIYRRPKPTPRSYEIFLKPLAKWVWISISAVMVVILIFLKIVFSNELSVRHKKHNGVDSSWSFLFLFTLGAFCQQVNYQSEAQIAVSAILKHVPTVLQAAAPTKSIFVGATCYPKLFSSRILSVFIYLFCILIYQFYSASIVSYLLMEPPRTINNLKDLVDSKLRVGIEDILIDRNYFVQTTDPIAIGLYKTKIQGALNGSGFYMPTDGLELVKEGGFAFHVESSTAYPIIEDTYSNELICELEEIQMYRTQPMYTNLQKNSPFREMMNYCMFKMAETGNIDRLRRYWDARKPNCIEAAKKVTIHVSLSEFSCGLMVLSFGICFSLFFLVIEIMYYNKNLVINPTIYPYVN